jgi:signal transduction histidine kinase
MRPLLQATVFRYGLAAVAVGAAALLTHFLAGVGDAGITPLFFAAVLLSAWYGGLGPGLLCTVLSGAATAYLLVRPHAMTPHAIQDHVLRLIVFTTVALLTSSLHGAIKRAAEASRRAREAAESASAAKSRFLAMVSHELRTPLSPVLMVAEMLEQDPSLPPAMRKDIQTIRRNVDLEIRLIEDLVDLTRVSVGKLHLRNEPLDLRDPLQAAVQVCRGDLCDKGLDLTVDLAAQPLPVEGDPVRLQQVFWNLLRNAIKFTPSGGRIRIASRINTRAEPGRGADHCAIVEIADTGIGIDPQQLSKIFEAFEQGEPDIQVRFGGLGLGLAICQAVVDAHHGSIAAASPGKGQGATFTVALPLAAQTPPRDKQGSGQSLPTIHPVETPLVPSLVTSGDD